MVDPLDKRQLWRQSVSVSSATNYYYGKKNQHSSNTSLCWYSRVAVVAGVKHQELESRRAFARPVPGSLSTLTPI